jgi:lysophospholipase L1-like esterase
MTDVTAREKALALVFALVLTATLIELGFRVFGPEYHKFNNMLAEYPTNPRGYFDLIRADGGEDIYGIRMNAAQGLGGRISATAPRGTKARILGLGDSQAQGQGVRFEDTMYAQLAALIGQSHRPTTIKNVAVSGYDLDEISARYALEARDPEQYDLVIYAMVLDDFGLERTEIDGLDFIQFQPGYTYDTWRARSATYNFFAHIKEQWELSEKTTQSYINSFQGSNLSERGDKLNTLAKAVKADGAELVVVVLPLLYDFEHYPFTAVHEALAQLSQKNDIQMVDALEALRAQKAKDLWVHPIDHHPNEVAHRLVAQAVYSHLLDQDLLGRPSK